jgi:tetratricopeptide (TPR) repeat protein
MAPDPKIVERILTLLREWGWETGLEKLQAETEATQDENQHAAWQLFTGWVAGERGAHAEALQQMKAVEHIPALAGWARVGQAFIALRERQDSLAHELLDQASTPDNLTDRTLRATIAHCRGVVYYHEGKSNRALPQLHEALELFGLDHFGTGRVLDTLGMVYANKNNFHAAREFYEQALKSKERFHDDAGIALGHGNLGRLYLDWGNLNKAEEHFTEDLRISQCIRDQRGEAQTIHVVL